MSNKDPLNFPDSYHNKLSYIYSLNEKHLPPVNNFFNKVKNVVIIASSSRGGSSVFTEILRQSPELIHFKAEINPFLVLAGLSHPMSGTNSDALDRTFLSKAYAKQLSVLEHLMCLDAGSIVKHAFANDHNQEHFIQNLFFRISIQWPEINFDFEQIQKCIHETFHDLHKIHDWDKNEFLEPQLFHILFLKKVHNIHLTINPYYYDLNPELIKKFFSNLCPNYAPPASFMIEEPPFVAITPWRPVNEEMLNKHTLIIKTPSNAYRLPFLKGLFPKAHFRILHLTRNPAASINGLCDGWRYNGFFAHQLSNSLNIQGYTDQNPQWGKSWWKFDLPPGWENLAHKSLEQVCAYQWQTAHKTILEFLKNKDVEFLRIQFEDIIGPEENKIHCLHKVCEWLNIDANPVLDIACGEIPPIMATTRPRLKRWFQNSAILASVIEDPAITQTTRQLGYNLNKKTWL